MTWRLPLILLLAALSGYIGLKWGSLWAWLPAVLAFGIAALGPLWKGKL